MIRIAHVTDLHLLEERYAERGVVARARLRYLAMGRRMSPEKRRRRAAHALACARALEPTHVVVTGDMTEDGSPAQFELFAELLAESGIPAHRITLVPGNHDFYAREDAWAWALDGPLRTYRATSLPLDPIAFENATILPICTAYHQSYARSAGTLNRPDFERLERLLRDPALAGSPLVLAQHHPPFRYACSALQWVDGFLAHRAERALLHAHANTYVLHGHIHAMLTLPLAPRTMARIFAADAVVCGRDPLRLYEIGPDGLDVVEVGRPPRPGRGRPEPRMSRAEVIRLRAVGPW